MTEPLAFLNGNFLPQSQVRLSINDAGLIFGATVTDLVRTFHHRLFRLQDHVTRFRESCRLVRVPLQLNHGDLIRLAEELVQRNAALLKTGQELALVMFATPGPIGYYLGGPGGAGDGQPTVCLHTFPLPFQRYGRLFREGARLIVPSIRHVAPESIPPQAKHRSRLHWWIAEQEVHSRDPSASALLLDHRGILTETAAANFLLVRDGKVLTPPRDRVLGGISLRVVEALCGNLDIPFAEAEITLDDCRFAEEAMLSSTSFCLAPVSRINDLSLDWPGPVFERLLSAWNDLAGLDIRGQICGVSAERP